MESFFKDVLVEWGVINVEIIIPKKGLCLWRCLWFQVIPEILTHSFLNGRFLALGLFVKRALPVFVPKLLMNRKTADVIADVKVKCCQVYSYEHLRKCFKAQKAYNIL